MSRGFIYRVTSGIKGESRTFLLPEVERRKHLMRWVKWWRESTAKLLDK